MRQPTVLFVYRKGDIYRVYALDNIPSDLPDWRHVATIEPTYWLHRFLNEDPNVVLTQLVRNWENL